MLVYFQYGEANEIKKILTYSLKMTFPILCGYIVLGAAFGLLLQQAGYSFVWAFFISVVVYAGSMQFLLVSLLSSGSSLLYVALMTLSLNSRHIFYGLSYLDKFKKMGVFYPYMIFSLTDETYSLLCSIKVPEDLDENKVYICISGLNHLYWIFGSVLGGLVGNFVPSGITGIEFAMTALFVVILIEQWKDHKDHRSVYVGAACALVCLGIFGASKFILPALFSVTFILLGMRSKIQRDGREIE